MPKVMINGRWMHIPDAVTTAEEIQQAGRIDPLRNLVQRTREGNFLVPKGAQVPVSDGDMFLDAPARIKGRPIGEGQPR